MKIELADELAREYFQDKLRLADKYDIVEKFFEDELDKQVLHIPMAPELTEKTIREIIELARRGNPAAIIFIDKLVRNALRGLRK
jgi:hypothetical protein